MRIEGGGGVSGGAFEGVTGLERGEFFKLKEVTHEGRAKGIPLLLAAA